MMHRSLLRSGSAVTKRMAPRPASNVRHFRKSAPTKYTENKELTGLAGIVEADNHVLSTKVQHLTSIGLMAAVPLAFVLSPSPLALPVDLALGVILPVHAHIGMNNVISDYVPKSVRTLARLGWLGATSLMFLGLLRVNLEGPGITEVVKTVWRESPNKKKVEA
ncbi:hypothetical protein PR003_g6969 [Phytophthora rubi]|uniref:Succinate dehydrogenase [ubiquinone] cytochrome b small subunit n=1 Tax=Phytophthora rubi TaxID=129364 RepID=A0A6A4FNA5_9STRA|nr:hypothetical protein PR002_g5535 [Phytophthora rubi]KAE9044279.1 hypothetical protein PR001_g5433 [Phytophthora rubi]KAE9347383.1 hypothetical protein PR003_g6969 [Phytophthora rubi]